MMISHTHTHTRVCNLTTKLFAKNKVLIGLHSDKEVPVTENSKKLNKNKRFSQHSIYITD